ncbi:hypothetical protein DL95DRAFT_524878 [Leptodontidium sp. 2 PMI_412]|nr:hypothetical protein DL95DRAFT_524878 [Leptodontidium sp. 2 PMI_412]
MSRMPSSATTGSFQPRPQLRNQFLDDDALHRVADFFLSSALATAFGPALTAFGNLALAPHVRVWTADAEEHPPFLRAEDSFGGPNELVTGDSWKRLKALGTAEGLVAGGHESGKGTGGRVVQFVKYHLWCGSSAFTTCPYAMTDGAATLLAKHLANKELAPELRAVLGPAYARMTTRDPRRAWTSGQWMTERVAGSDLTGTETLAEPLTAAEAGKGVDGEGAPLGPWSITGFKWFSSATDSNMAVLLARTPDGELSAFYGPMRRRRADGAPGSELNGVTIRRLKRKLGTKALPTAELELQGMRAWLIGQQGDGVREISALLNVTRVHNSVIAMGLWGRALAVSRAWARVRRVAGGRLLSGVAPHVATMAAQEVTYRGWMSLTFFMVVLVGGADGASAAVGAVLESGLVVPARADAAALLRLLTPVVKAVTAKAAIAGVAECVESLGGVGYCENEDVELNLARVMRDVMVTSIWEGTTDVLAGDMVRVVKGRVGPAALAALERWVVAMGGGDSALGKWARKVQTGSVEKLLLDGREVMEELGRGIAALLLEKDAARDGDVVAAEVARRWREGPKVFSYGVKERVEWDRKIVFGEEEGRAEAKL